MRPDVNVFLIGNIWTDAELVKAQLREEFEWAPRATAAETAPCRPPTLIALASLPITSVINDAGVQRGVVRRRVPDVWRRERLQRRRADGEPEAAATDAPT